MPRPPASRRAALYGGGDPDQSPPGLSARILELGEELRGEGVALGTSELLDAFAVLREVPWSEPVDFKESLAATLAKSQEDRRIFDLVFDRFFFRAAEAQASRLEVGEGRGQLGAEDVDLDALRQQIAAALQGSDAS